MNITPDKKDRDLLTHLQNNARMTSAEIGGLIGLSPSGIQKRMRKLEDNGIIETQVPRMVNSGNTAPIYHAKSRPKDAENTAIRNCIDMARETGGRLFLWPRRGRDVPHERIRSSTPR